MITRIRTGEWSPAKDYGDRPWYLIRSLRNGTAQCMLSDDGSVAKWATKDEAQRAADAANPKRI